MEKRKIIFGTYDTAIHGWTLTGWTFEKPTFKESYLSVPGHDGDLDVSTVLTDGEPRYGNRAFEATFESSEGTRMDREAVISEMVNALDGLRMNIVLPDDPYHYITGRVRVEPLYNDLAHASVKVTANCEPWRYNVAETVIPLSYTPTTGAVIYNRGRRSVVPTINVRVGLNLTFGTSTVSLSEGTHVWPALYLTPGRHVLHVEGYGTLTYREAVL